MSQDTSASDLEPEDLDEVSGGLNPQPLPPYKLPTEGGAHPA